MTRAVLVTGGAGFIGSHTVDLLLQKKFAVTVFDNLSTGKLTNLNLEAPGLRFVRGDVLNYEALQAEVETCEAVLHLAALPSVPQSIEDPLSAHAVNLTGFLHVLQAIRASSHPLRLVYASSSAIYGETESLPCRDEAYFKPAVLSPYALQKVQCELYADLYARLFSLRSLGLRYFNVYGGRQDPQSVYAGVISRFLANYKKGAKVSIFGDGLQSRDFIHVSDVARANCLALEGAQEGVLNIATGVPETLLNLLSYIEASGGRKAAVEFLPGRLGDIRASYAAIERAEQALAFRPEVALEKGIQLLMQDSE